jgi:transcriptional regulator with XRE-family HTH domain
LGRPSTGQISRGVTVHNQPVVNPTIQRRRLGYALKRARESAGKTQDDAAAVIDAAASKVSRIELGQSGVRLTDLALLIDLYGVPADEAESMRELARAGRQRGRWSGYRSIVPDWVRQYVDLEADATQIRWYQPEIVPGILQIEPYIRAVSAATDPGADEEELDRRVKVRMDRQAIIEDGAEVSFILSESALRRRIGGPETMRQQLEHLGKLARRPNIDVQIYPFDAETHEPASYGFIMLGFGDDTGSDVVYLEDFTDASYLDRPDAVRAYNRLWSRLRAAALGPAESRRMILRLAKEIPR